MKRFILFLMLIVAAKPMFAADYPSHLICEGTSGAIINLRLNGMSNKYEGEIGNAPESSGQYYESIAVETVDSVWVFKGDSIGNPAAVEMRIDPSNEYRGFLIITYSNSSHFRSRIYACVTP